MSVLSALASLLGTLLKLAAGVLAFMLMLGALLVGAALALGLVGWALLRGRRPQVQVFSSAFQRMRRTSARAHSPGHGHGHGPAPYAGAARRPAGPAPAATVIDVEAREVPDDGRPTTALRPER